MFQAGVEKYLIGETEDAYNLLKQAVKVDSGNDEMKRFFVKIISEMAVNEVINGNYKNAAALLEEALKVYPTKELREMLSRALILRNEGLGGMKEERSAAENRNREMMGKFFNEGTALYQKGEFKKAIAAWEKVLAIDPAHEPSKDVIKKARAQLKKKKEK